MNFFKRALTSISRKKGKSLLLFAIVFILGNVIAGAVSISQATNKVEQTVKNQLGAQATIDLSKEKMKQLMDASEDEEVDYPKPPSKDVITKIGQLDTVKYYDYNISDYYNSKKVKAYLSPEDEKYGNSSSLSIRGVQYAPLIDVKENKIKLDSGTTFTDDQIKNGANVVIVSSQVAKLNNLSVGDNFLVDNVYLSYDDDKEKELFSKEYSYKVIGIFTPTKLDTAKKLSADKKAEQEWQANEQINTIYLPNKVVSKANTAFQKEAMKKDKNSAEGMTEAELAEYTKNIGNEDGYESVFVVKTPEDMPNFVADASTILPKDYAIVSAQDDYDSISGSMNKVAKFSKYILLAAAAASVIILTLVIILFIRDRKKELGIYLSLGEKKLKIIGQIFIEVLLVAFIAISLSLFTGNLLAKNVSTSLITNDAKTDDMNGGSMSYSHFSTNSTVDFDSVKDAYAVTIDAPYIALFYLFGLVTVILSTVLPMLYILRLNPKKIMM
ncbi:ABC transporter permease [Brochothrix campestris]|uniref:ABC transporter permease n=1 Tax=Brochothrix campestris FSL F6-1037 TaxID=1265861 RepID=W7CEB8_9LIST|nr:ABC transporter permease [Brochothrix campestris]EUJ37654.1 hypothetical protein BCAMP_09850 [Brochothrix campestris FSL F6-1037]